MKSETLKLLHLAIHMEQQKIGKPSTNRQKQMRSVYKNFHQKANLKGFVSEQKIVLQIIKMHHKKEPGIQQVQPLTFHIRRRVVIVTKSVHRLQIRLIVHN